MSAGVPAPAAPPPPAAQGQPPPATQPDIDAIVYYADGRYRAGPIAPFEAAAGIVRMLACAHDPQPYDVPLEAVMMVDFASSGGAAVVAPEGYHVRITVANGAVIEGITLDYAADAQWVWIVPDDTSRSVARVWIPIWAVGAFEFLAA